MRSTIMEHGLSSGVVASPIERDRNREGWLTEAGGYVEGLFNGIKVGPYRVTCGWPSRNATGMRRRFVGQCHYPLEQGGYHELFISPLLDDPGDVLGTLAHEIVHVVAGNGAGHGPGFVRFARHVGLTKGHPASAEPGPDLAERLKRLAERLGPYPHTALKLRTRPAAAKKLRTVEFKCGAGHKVKMSVYDFSNCECVAPTCGCGEPFALLSPGG